MKRGSKSAVFNSIAMLIVKAALIASVVTILLIVIYAFILHQGWLSENTVSIANSLIKVIGAVIASLLVVRKCEKLGWLYGALAGVVYILFAFIVFSLLTDTFTISLALLSDLGVGFLAGMVSAMVVQARK